MGEADFRSSRSFPNLTRGNFSSALFRSDASRKPIHPRSWGGLPILIQRISAPVIKPHAVLGLILRLFRRTNKSKGLPEAVFLCGLPSTSGRKIFGE
jgi:hypothetical protein